MGHSGPGDLSAWKEDCGRAVLGDETECGVLGSMKVAETDVRRDIASMGRLPRAGFDMHFSKGTPKEVVRYSDQAERKHRLKCSRWFASHIFSKTEWIALPSDKVV